MSTNYRNAQCVPVFQGWTFGVQAGRCITKDGEPFVTVQKCNGTHAVEADAFCHTIALAVNSHADLLSALHDLLEIVEAEYADDPEPGDLASWDRAIKAARAAIAKTE